MSLPTGTHKADRKGDNGKVDLKADGMPTASEKTDGPHTGAISNPDNSSKTVVSSA